MKKIAGILFVFIAFAYSASWTITTLPSDVCTYLDQTDFVANGSSKYFIIDKYDSAVSAYKVYVVTGNGTTWVMNQVEQLGTDEYYQGGQHGIAIGKNGNIHITYATQKYLGASTWEYNLKYAKWNGITWASTTIVSASPDYIDDPAIAVDVTNDYAHLAYEDGSGSDIKYKNNVAGNFNMAAETVSDAYYGAAISCDTSGIPTIVSHSGSGGLGIYKKVLGTWAEVGNVSGGSFASYFDVFIYASIVYVPYEDYTNEDVKCAIYNGSTTSIVDVDVGDAKVGNYIHGTIDSQGIIHLVYYDYSFDDLKYAKSNSAGGWSVQVLDSTGKVGRNPAICISQGGLINIIYYDETNSQTKYAYSTSTTTSTGAGVTLPPDVTLINNMFKPLSNENVEVKVDVNTAGNLKISLYSMQGKLIKVLNDAVKDTGRYSYYWNGTNTDGETIASGLYLVVTENGGTRVTKKIVVVK